MAEILLCSQPTSSHHLSNQCGINTSDVLGLNHGTSLDTLQAYTPYMIGENLTGFDRNLLGQLNSRPVTHNLTNLCLSHGEDNTLALAEIMSNLQNSGVAMMGASTSLYGNRMQGFGKAVEKYQQALLAYRDAIKSGPSARVVAKEKAFRAFNEMQRRFRNELSVVTSTSRARRGTVLGNPTRGTNIARSSRSVAKLNITNQVQASQLVRYGKQAKFLGNGLVLVDLGNRVGNIHTSYKAGGNWERDLFIESSGLFATVSTGVITAKAGVAALGFLVAATPIGWVGLIVGGLVVAGTSAAATMAVNDYSKNNSGNLYDKIMNWIMN